MLRQHRQFYSGRRSQVFIWRSDHGAGSAAPARTIFVFGVTLAVLVGCGGGGGGNTTTSGGGTTATTYSVSATVTGLSGSGLTLKANGTIFAVNGNGPLVLASGIPAGSAYSVAVTASPENPAQTCTVSNDVGTVSSDVSLTVSCVVTGTPTAAIDAPAQVMSYSTVILDGTVSRDATETITSYSWQQTAGPTVTLTGSSSSQASFTAPNVSSNATLTFGLTITDSANATSTATTSINIWPATPAQLQARFVALRFLHPLPADGHNDFGTSDGPPLAGSTTMVQVTLAGAVQVPTFNIVDANGNVLSAASLTVAASPSSQPIDFGGTITVPSVPFRITASGMAANGQSYSLQSPSLITPMNMTVTFMPRNLRVARGASGTAQLSIYNGGNAATFTVSFNDPNGLLATSNDVSVQIGQGQSVAVPVSVTFPQGLMGKFGPALNATASVAGDANRVGTATLKAWLVGGS